MGPILLKHIIDELNASISGGIISRIHQSDERTLVFRIFSSGTEKRLLISTDPLRPRMHLTEDRYINPQNPLRFCAYLRSRISDASILRLTQVPGQRIITIDIRKRAVNGFESYKLIVELTGKSANIILTDAQDIICDALRRFPLTGKGVAARPVEPGLRLAPLPTTGYDTKEEFTEVPPGVTWNEAAARYYGDLSEKYDLASHRSALISATDASIKKLARKLDNLKGDYKKAEARLVSAHLGDVLKSHYGKLKRGLASIELEDYMAEPVAMIHIPLDAALGPRENIEKYFKLAKKARTGMELLKTRIPETEGEIEYLEGVRCNIMDAQIEDDLLSIEEELLAGRYIRKTEETGTKKRMIEEKTEPIRIAISSEGFTILCGKSGAGNDLIVKKHAVQGDIWLHASKCPGSHVLIKTAGRNEEMTKKTIEEAASMAAFYSKNKNASKVEVIYTDARNVKKPKGAKPGMVTVKEYKSIVVRPAEGVK